MVVLVAEDKPARYFPSIAHAKDEMTACNNRDLLRKWGSVLCSRAPSNGKS